MTSGGGRKRKASVRFLVSPPLSPSSVSFGIHVAGRVSAFTVAPNVKPIA